MNDPVGKNSPVGADLDTWSWYTHHDDEIILVSQALERQTVKMAAYYKVVTGATPAFGGPLMIVDAAPP